VEITRDGGKTWTNISDRFPGLPKYTYVSTVLASRHVAGRAFATFDGHYSDDYKPYLFMTEDFGQTWKAMSGAAPTSINRVREHPRSASVILVGHEKGATFSADLGRSWFPLSLISNFPTVSVDDIAVHPRDNSLVLGTHGRGIWILDDMGPLEGWTSAVATSEATLFPIAPARLMITNSPQAWFGTGTFFAPNPEFDAGINYYLRDAAAGPVQIEISDVFGKKTRTLEGPGAKGLNHAAWNLRADPPVPPPVDAAATPAPAATGRGGRAGGAGAVGAAAQGGRGGGRGGQANAPLVPPGKYFVVVRVPGLARELRGEVTVESDPIAVKR
jgi:hypothetical protein